MAFLSNSPQVKDDKRTGLTFRGDEIVLSKATGNPRTGGWAKRKKGMYPEEKMIETATLFAATGDLDKTAELCKVTPSAIRTMIKKPEFQAILQEVWKENNLRFDAKFTRIIEKTLDAIEDRLDNGDTQVLKDGTLIRRPISGKDLSLISAINVDKRQLLRGEPTSRSESTNSAQDSVTRLEKLAETFENLARIGRKPQVIEVQEAEIVKEEVVEGHIEATPEISQPNATA